MFSSSREASNTIAAFQDGKLRHRKINELPRDCTAGQLHTWKLDLALQTHVLQSLTQCRKTIPKVFLSAWVVILACKSEGECAPFSDCET